MCTSERKKYSAPFIVLPHFDRFASDQANKAAKENQVYILERKHFAYMTKEEIIINLTDK